MSLDVVHDEHRRHRPRELAERVEDVLCLPGDAGLERRRRIVETGGAQPACRVTGKYHRVVPPITSVRFGSLSRNASTSRNISSFRIASNVDTGPLNAHIAPS